MCVTVLGHRCRSDTPKRLPTTDEEQIYPEDTCGATHDVRLSIMQRYFKDVCAHFLKHKPLFNLHNCVLLITC